MRIKTRRVEDTGFTLIEAVATLLALGVVVVHLAMALRQLAYADRQRQRHVAVAALLAAKMEELAATPYQDLPLSAPAGEPGPFSDTVEIPQMGRLDREVVIDPADADGDDAPDAGFKRVTVRLAGQHLVAYRAGAEE